MTTNTIYSTMKRHEDLLQKYRLMPAEERLERLVHEQPFKDNEIVHAWQQRPLTELLEQYPVQEMQDEWQQITPSAMSAPVLDRTSVYRAVLGAIGFAAGMLIPPFVTPYAVLPLTVVGGLSAYELSTFVKNFPDLLDDHRSARKQYGRFQSDIQYLDNIRHPIA